MFALLNSSGRADLSAVRAVGVDLAGLLTGGNEELGLAGADFFAVGGDDFLDDGGDEWELMSENGARSYLASMRVVELKEQLRERRAPVSGTKAELVDRLLRYRIAP